MNPKPKPVDLENFRKPNDELDILYGLPREVKFCKSCVISNQRPNSAIEFLHTEESTKETIRFDENGLCDACRATKAKHDTNWDERDKMLRELCDRHRRTDGRFDCILPGSGGKDSIYASLVLKEEYGMHPLTITWAPHVYTDWGWKNFQNWIHAGLDNCLFTPNGKVHRLLSRLALENLFHPFQPFIFGQKNLGPKIAAQYGVNLVFFGENEAEYGNPVEEMDTAIRDSKYFALEDQSNIYLGGTSVQQLLEDYGLEKNELEFYMPAKPEMLENSNVEVHYMGFYKKWHPQSCYYYSRDKANFIPSPHRTPGTYSKYNSIDDRIDDFHYLTSYIKFGIGRATYDAAQEIRSGDIERHEGVALVKRYDGEYPEIFSDEIFKYLSINEHDFPVASKMFEQPEIDKDYFLQMADSFRSAHLWRHENGAWTLRHAVWDNKK